MSTPAPTDPTTPTAEPTAPAAEPAQAPAKPEVDWKAEARKHEQRAKENAAKAKQFDELLESQKTEAQKLADRAAAAEKERDEARLEAVKFEVAQSKGLTAGQTKRLVGATREELEADAEQLLADLKQANRPGGPADQGQRGTAPTADPRQAMAAFLQQNGLR